MIEYPTISTSFEKATTADQIRSVASRYGLTLKALASILGVRTSKAYAKPCNLSIEQMELLIQLDYIMKITIDYFGDEERAQRWFFKSNRVLGGDPINLLRTAEGSDQVKNHFVKLAHGMTA